MPDDSFEGRVAQLSERRRLLLERLRQQRQGPGRPAAIRPRPSGVDRVPLSQAQEQLWFLAQLAPDEPTYNLVQASYLVGPLDLVALRRALDEVVRRHEALRTVIESTDDTAYQVVCSPGPAALEIDDVSVLPASERRHAALLLLQDHEVHRPFDLASGPLFRARLVRLGPTEHALALAVHHSTADGWSMGLIIRELSTLYAAYRSGTAADLPAPALQFADFAAWQRRQLRADAMERHLRYWQDRLVDLPTLDLPTDRSRPAATSFRGALLEQPIDRTLHTAVQAMAKETGASSFMVLVAAFGATLARYTGQEDLAIGTAFSGRGRPELEKVVGFFANMGVLRIDASGNPTFATLVDRARDTCLGAWEHQDAPFERVVQRVAPLRDPSRNPLFQVAVQMLTSSTWGGPGLPGTDSFPVDLRLERSRFDLTVSLVDHGDRYSILAEYSTDLFGRQRIQRLLVHFERVLAAGLADPTRRLSEFPLLTEEERREVLAFGVGERRPVPRTTALRMFAEQARRRRDTVAVRHDGLDLSYRALDDRARRLAGRLRAAGVRPKDPVPVLLDRGFDEVVAPLAIWYAGAVHVPLDTAAPPNRLRRIITNTGARLAVTRTEYAARMPTDGPWRVLHLDDRDPEVDAPRTVDDLAASSTGLDDVAYILHTSGSTGDPKGVQIDHAGLVNYLDWMVGEWRCGPGDRILHAGAPIFDLAAGETLAALTSGATLVVIGKEQLLSPDGLVEVLSREQITHLLLTPTGLSLADADPDRLPDLREVFVAGEVCSAELAVRWSRPGRCRLANLYGPTEITIANTAYDCTGWSSAEPPPIGRSLPNRHLYLLDRWGQPVPAGVPGEIVVGGVGVSRGYLNEPELTARTFTDDPFAPGARVYRTGDRGVWTDDGLLRFVDRLDGQVKLRGLRIELAEVETTLARHEDVDQVAATVVRDGSGTQRLVAYVVPVADQIDAAALRAYAAEELPAHMVPGQVLHLSALPLTGSGKIDRRALPPPAPDGAEVEDRAMPADPAERQVAAVFAEVLGVPSVAVDRSFFDLGGHSLQAAYVLARIARQTGVTIGLKQFYADPTVRTLAGLVGRGSAADAGRSPLVTLKAEGSRPRLYCLHAVSGSPYWYLPLSRALHPEQPLDGFEAPGLEGDAEPVEDLTALAARYVDALRERQPAGPYLLAGWSMGGFLSFEMARQLAAVGESPALVAMIDSNEPGPLPLPSEQEVMETFVSDLGGLAGTAPPVLPAEIARAASTDPAVLTAFLVEHGMVPADVRADFVSHRYRVFRANMRAVYGYRPGPYAGRVVMVQAAEEPSRAAWARHAGAMETVTLPGNHYSLWSAAHLPGLAAMIDARVGEAMAGD
uniref:Amino acid adenylation domain n=1 Tax=Salinispora arenicola (strain CNS-205) TaxID=391037 RepID=A8M7B5_SALAI